VANQIYSTIGTLPAPPVAAGGHYPESLENDLHPEACAQCHATQYADWRGSRHAMAWSPGLVGQFPALGVEEANACLSCHAPLAGQRLHGGSAVHRAASALAAQPHRWIEDPDWDGLQRKPLGPSGVSCAVCHVRNGRRFGPPPIGTERTGQVTGPAHGGFTAVPAFEASGFCATCHQFPDSMAVNGKPLENTLNEWRQSRFAREGVHCQNCHMPDRRHRFRGIHDPEMTRKGVMIRIEEGDARRGPALLLHSRRVGHAFPTYVTPEITVRARALDAAGRMLREWRWIIGRQVQWNDGWQELRDSRLLPGETRRFAASPLPSNTARVRFTVDVEPDHFYKGVYRDLLQDGGLPPAARKLIRRALRTAQANDYRLFSGDASPVPASR